MKTTFWGLVIFFILGGGRASAQEAQPVLNVPIGTKIKILEDRRPNGPVAGEIAVCVEVRHEGWILLNLNFQSDFSKLITHVTQRPVEYRPWDPFNSNSPLPTTKKLAVLLGNPILRLERSGSLISLKKLGTKVQYLNEDLPNRLSARFAQLAQAVDNLATTLILPANPSQTAEDSSEKPDLPSVHPSHQTNLGTTDYQWPLKTLDGQDFLLSSIRKKVIFLNVWATWCPPCRWEMPGLQKLYDQMKDEVIFIFVSKEAPKTVKEFVNLHDYTLPMYIASAESVPALFVSNGIPVTFIIAPNGQIVFKEEGAREWNNPAVIKFLRSLKK